MQAEELLKLVAEIKRQRTVKQNVELKAANKGCPSRLYDTLSSFSNQDSGGVILFGIDENSDYSVASVKSESSNAPPEHCIQSIMFHIPQSA